MADNDNIIDKCVKCACRFTSPDKPLKLLPCLHSMCLDCLYGRIPPKKAPPEEDSSKTCATTITNDTLKSEACSESKEVSNKENTQVSVLPQQEKTDETVESNGGSKENSPNQAENENQQTDTNTTKESENVKKEADSNSGSAGSSTDQDGEQNAAERRASQEKEDSNQNQAKPQAETNGESDKTNGSPETQHTTAVSEREETPAEPVEEKPKPVTECPVCRDPIEQQGACLMDNMFASLELGKPATPTEDVPHMCTACDEGQEAPFYCVQCEEWLCDSCVDAHKRVRITKDHTIMPKDEVKVAVNKSPWEQQMMCKQHRQEELKFFCERCEKLTCRDCQLMDHKDHKYQFLDQAADQYKQRLRGSLALMGEKRTKLATSRDEIEQKLKNCKEQKENLQQDILKQTDVLVKGIRQAVWGVLANLASFTDAANKRLNKEIDDVSDLVGKFDHCIQFMEDILREGSSMSLLYSKGNVETKCRKVYHTQVDPQSLKGTLTIQYKHEVNWLLGNLGKIGAIFVNGVRYPPDKNMRAGASGGPAQQSSQSFQDNRGGMGTTSPHLQHMANQPIPGQRVPPEWNKFIQTVPKPGGLSVAPPNMTMSSMMAGAGSLPPQLTLPSNRRGSGASVGHPQWQAPPGIPSSTFPGHFVAGQLLTPQQQSISRPTFPPMKLNHRPATQNSFSGTNEHASAGNNMRSPPLYNRQGSEASGTSRSAHSTPDPARPASAGMYNDNANSARPDSGGGSAMVDVKKERREHSPDCVIMSSSMKSTDRSPAYTSIHKHSETVLEMQRNLDEVLRAVPMDLSENMEQISGSKPRSSVQSERAKSSSMPPSHAVNSSRPPVLVAAPTTTSHVKEGNHGVSDASSSNVEAQPHSPTDQELRANWQGGNSMPGFSLAQAGSQGDPNDDYCACCHNGGDVLCCDRCPKVFHLQCHIPEMTAVPTGSFVCTICEGDNQMTPEEATTGKRKVPGGLTSQEIKVCERILLDMFCHPSSVPFQEPVNRLQVPNYYKIITQPMDFTQIKCKLQRQHPNHYQSVKAYLWDLRQVFINCAIYNKAGSEVGKAGKIVRALFESLVGRLIPQYLSFVEENPTPCFSALQQKSLTDTSDDKETAPETSEPAASSPKRPRLDGD